MPVTKDIIEVIKEERDLIARHGTTSFAVAALAFTAFTLVCGTSLQDYISGLWVIFAVNTAFFLYGLGKVNKSLQEKKN